MEFFSLFYRSTYILDFAMWPANSKIFTFWPCTEKVRWNSCSSGLSSWSPCVGEERTASSRKAPAVAARCALLCRSGRGRWYGKNDSLNPDVVMGCGRGWVYLFQPGVLGPGKYLWGRFRDSNRCAVRQAWFCPSHDVYKPPLRPGDHSGILCSRISVSSESCSVVSTHSVSSSCLGEWTFFGEGWNRNIRHIRFSLCTKFPSHMEPGSSSFKEAWTGFLHARCEIGKGQLEAMSPLGAKIIDTNDIAVLEEFSKQVPSARTWKLCREVILTTCPLSLPAGLCRRQIVTERGRESLWI